MLALLPASAHGHFGSGARIAHQIAAEKFPGACAPTITQHVPMRGLAYTAFRGCRIRLADGWHRESFTVRCSALVHEYGHLAGHRHSDNPASVMFESLVVFFPCRTAMGSP